MHRILIINLGDTSTKVSIFEDEALVLENNFHYTDEDLKTYNTQQAQIDLRKGDIIKWLAENDMTPDHIDAAVVRLTNANNCHKSGTYRMNDMLRAEIYQSYAPGELFFHAGWLTLPLADQLFEGYDVPIYMVDPTTVDEMKDVARISGHPLVRRVSMQHTLNQKAVARQAAKDLGKKYEEAKLVLVHMGGGVSVSAHEYGKIIDTDGGPGISGPFASNRSGGLFGADLIELCFSGKYTKNEIYMSCVKKGGFVGYLGVGDMITILQMIEEGNKKAELVYDAFIYQIAKEIACQASAMCFDFDAIVLTGGIAHSEKVVKDITTRVGKLAPIMVYPGEMEIQAMVAGALRVLRGEEEEIIYEGETERNPFEGL